jgi:holo-[acyl-carrier protein] synthase
MIVSIGVDMVEIHRVARAMARTPRFVERVFTVREREECDAKGASSAQSFAGRFAAKEAFLKAARTGWRGKIAWRDIEIITDELGAPSFELTGDAKVIMAAAGASSVHLSISHTAEHAIATVILEKV